MAAVTLICFGMRVVRMSYHAANAIHITIAAINPQAKTGDGSGKYRNTHLDDLLPME